jgi:hypothetical protein
MFGHELEPPVTIAILPSRRPEKLSSLDHDSEEEVAPILVILEPIWQEWLRMPDSDRQTDSDSDSSLFNVSLFGAQGTGNSDCK